MPFTPAHAAAALPFRRVRLPVAAVVIGSMAPDLVYFLRTIPRGRIGHTLPGVFLVDLPGSLILFWIWRTYLRPATLATILSPEDGVAALHSRRWGLRECGEAALACLVGIGTHLLWDSFTHRRMWPYHHIAFLRSMVVVPGVGPVFVYDVLQMASSVVGLAILAIWGYLRWRRGVRDERMHLPVAWRWGVVAAILVGAGVALLRAWLGTRHIADRQGAQLLFVVEFLVTWMDVLFAEWLGVSMKITWRLARRRSRSLVAV